MDLALTRDAENPSRSEEPSSGGRSLRSQGGGPFTSWPRSLRLNALRVWVNLLVPGRPAQDPRARPPRIFGETARSNKKGAPEDALTKKGRGGSRSRSPPPVAEASGLRAAGLSPRWPRSLRL